MEIYSIWVKSENDSLNPAVKLINKIAQEEGTATFDPHVTLVSNIFSLDKAEQIIDKIVKKKIIVNFDSFGTGNSYFQRLYLTSSDNFGFFNAVSKIEVGQVYGFLIYLCITATSFHMLFSLDQINKEIPLEAVFDKLELCITGPDISEWKEVTTVFLD